MNRTMPIMSSCHMINISALKRLWQLGTTETPQAASISLAQACQSAVGLHKGSCTLTEFPMHRTVLLYSYGRYTTTCHNRWNWKCIGTLQRPVL